MRINLKEILVGAAIFLGIVVIALVFGDSKPKYEWKETYRPGKDQPYDLSLFRRTMRTYFPDHDFIELSGWSADTTYTEATSSNMVYIGKELPADSAEIRRILHYVARGNTAFISTDAPGDLLAVLLSNCPPRGRAIPRQYSGSTAELTTIRQDFRVPIEYAIGNQNQSHAWVWIEIPPCTREVTRPLGYVFVDGVIGTNFFELSHGNGRVILHTTPLAFSNYHFRDEDMFRYAGGVFSTLTAGDVYYVSPAPDASTGEVAQNAPGPLEFILSHPPLRWAWYGGIALALLFVWNGTRRDRRVIPVLMLPENHTLRHIAAMEGVYKREKNHRHIVALEYDLLKTHLRNRYRLNPDAQYVMPSEGGQDFYREASIRLEMEETYLRWFFATLDIAARKDRMSDHELLKLDKTITEFYNACP